MSFASSKHDTTKNYLQGDPEVEKLLSKGK
jgi:hypothetical protein